jgi:N-acetylmuramoyl-L-alanine amidase
MKKQYRLYPQLSLFLIVLLTPIWAVQGQSKDSSGGTASLPLAAAVSELQAQFYYDPLSRTGEFQSPSHHILFFMDDTTKPSYALVDGILLFSVPSPFFKGSTAYFPESFVSTLKTALANLQDNGKGKLRIAAIIIDPGHGGKDNGAVATHLIGGKSITIKEKDVTLQVSLKLRDLLKTKYPEKKILMTRDSDTYPTLEDRVAIANSVPLRDNEAIVFISIHANASFNKSARGYEVWYLSPEYRRTLIDKNKTKESTEVLPILNAMLEEEFTTESILMARSIMNRFDQTIGKLSPPRGIKAEEWFVVRNARMPSVLVELGFVTNPEDAKLFLDPEYLRKLSEALYKGTIDFIGTFEQSGGFTTVR